MNTQIIAYVRDRHNDPIGVVAAVQAGGRYSIGWSLTKRSCGDKFNKEMGIQIAVGRAAVKSRKSVPHTVKPMYDYMKVRAAKYFKNCEFVE